MKQSLPKTGTQKSLYDGYLVEYAIRKKIRKKYLKDSGDKFLTFFDLVKRVYSCKRRNRDRQPLQAIENKDVFNSSDDLFD